MNMPGDYGLKATETETYVALAVQQLLDDVEPENLHLGGELSKEYLGMLALYALQRAETAFSDQEDTKNLVKLVRLAQEHFDPNSLSVRLIDFLTDLIQERREQKPKL